METKALKTKFLDSFLNSSTITVDGVVIQDYNQLPRTGSDASVYMPSEDPVIYFEYKDIGEPKEFIIEADDLEEVSLNEDGQEWSIGGYSVRFI